MGLGLLFEAPVKITPAQIANGGWLFVDFTAGTNPYQAAITANPDLIRTFAAPIPVLGAAQIQMLTTAEIDAQK